MRISIKFQLVGECCSWRTIFKTRLLSISIIIWHGKSVFGKLNINFPFYSFVKIESWVMILNALRHVKSSIVLRQPALRRSFCVIVCVSVHIFKCKFPELKFLTWMISYSIRNFCKYRVMMHAFPLSERHISNSPQTSTISKPTIFLNDLLASIKCIYNL